MRRLVLWVACLAVLLASCGGGDGVTSGGGATLRVIDTSASVRLTGADFIEAAGGEVLAVGDRVRTDDSGFGQIDYPDGSVTRVDRSTTFEVVSLAAPGEALDVEIRLDVGRVWNRVQDLGEGGRFAVSTAVGVAAVRGTTFAVTCLDTGACFVEVIEGDVALDTMTGNRADLGAGDRVDVDADGNITETITGRDVADVIATDAWYGRNATRDANGSFGGDVIVGGRWTTTYGEMTFIDGTPLTATYSGEDGNLEGTVIGRVYAGTWVEPESRDDCGVPLRGETHWGRFEFVFDEQLQSFNGTWSYCDDELGGAWNGTRQG